jgi:hypothetical protein
MKRGEITSKQLITIIILIVSFSIILIFLGFLGLRGIISQQSCKQSLLMKESFPDFFGIDFSKIKINCEPEVICFSKGGGCDRGREIEVESRKELYSEVGKLGLDCWGLVGEGEINFAKGKKGMCGVCKIMYFGEDIKNDGSYDRLFSHHLYNVFYEDYGVKTQVSLGSFIEDEAGSRKWKASFSTDKPLSLLVYSKKWGDKYSLILFSEYTEAGLQLKCEKFLF